MTAPKLLVSFQQRSVFAQDRLLSQPVVQRFGPRISAPTNTAQQIERAALQRSCQAVALPGVADAPAHRHRVTRPGSQTAPITSCTCSGVIPTELGKLNARRFI